jgi:ADP-heptose:LPS heptosyltransferase
MLKRLEHVGKHLLARVAGLLLWRPGRARAARLRLGEARRVLLVRADARVGEALLTTPLLGALSLAQPPREVDLLVHPRCAPLLMGTGGARSVLSFDPRRLWLGAFAPGVRALRQKPYDVVVDCSNWTAPSVTSAIVSRLIARRAVVVGPSGPPLTLLRDVAVAPRSDTRSEVAQRLHLLSPLLGAVPPAPLTFRPIPKSAPSPLLEELAHPGRLAVVNPGGRLGWRRVPPLLFGAAARALVSRGFRVVITWGPGEESLAQEVVAAAPGAMLAPATSLEGLAWLLARARVAVTNNTGPMHLAVAVGTPTLGLFLAMEVARWGHLQPPHEMVDLTQALASGGDGEALVLAGVQRILQR